MQQQLPRIALGRGGYPNAREAIRHEQIQYMPGIASIRLLLAHHRSANLGGIAHPQCMSAALQQALEPLCRARCFHPDQRSPRQGFVESRGLISFVAQPSLHEFVGLQVQRGDLLVARVKIATYNPHSSAPFFRALVVSATKSTRSQGADAFMESNKTAALHKLRGD